jgi:hypothetical protein
MRNTVALDRSIGLLVVVSVRPPLLACADFWARIKKVKRHRCPVDIQTYQLYSLNK